MFGLKGEFPEREPGLANGGTYYYLTDGLGSVTDLTDHQGEVVQKYRYDAFGGLFTGTVGLYNTNGLAGKAYDPASGLMDYSARWYDPRVGRFTQADSYRGGLSDPITQHRYAFVGNNPVNWMDPTGHYITGDPDSGCFDASGREVACPGSGTTPPSDPPASDPPPSNPPPSDPPSSDPPPSNPPPADPPPPPPPTPAEIDQRDNQVKGQYGSPSASVTVESGDTLSGIAARVGISLAQLLAANPAIANPNLIHVGQILNVPVPAVGSDRPGAPVSVAAEPVAGDLECMEYDCSVSGSQELGGIGTQDTEEPWDPNPYGVSVNDTEPAGQMPIGARIWSALKGVSKVASGIGMIAAGGTSLVASAPAAPTVAGTLGLIALGIFLITDGAMTVADGLSDIAQAVTGQDIPSLNAYSVLAGEIGGEPGTIGFATAELVISGTIDLDNLSTAGKTIDALSLHNDFGGWVFSVSPDEADPDNWDYFWD